MGLIERGKINIGREKTVKMSEKAIRNHVIIHRLKIMNKVYIYVSLYIYSLHKTCWSGLTILPSRALLP